jgi:hypothetical protein
MGTKRVGLARTKALIQGLKRQLNLSGSTMKGLRLIGADSENDAGDGMTNVVSNPRVQTIGNVTTTTILVDLGASTPASGATAGWIVGEKGSTGAAYLTKFTNEESGYITNMQVTCVELPTSGSTDIDFYLTTTSLTGGQEPAGGETLINSGAWALGETSGLYDPKDSRTLDWDDKYLYLVCPASSSEYGAGQFVITVTGKKSF